MSRDINLYSSYYTIPLYTRAGEVRQEIIALVPRIIILIRRGRKERVACIISPNFNQYNMERECFRL